MADAGLTSHFDARTSTLEVGGTIDPGSLPELQEALDRAFRRTACVMTLDLTRVERVRAHSLGQLIHLCNTRYPGTLVRLPTTQPSRVPRRASA